MMCLLFTGSPLSTAAIVFYTCVCVPFHGLKRVAGRLRQGKETEGRDCCKRTPCPVRAISGEEEKICPICLVEMKAGDVVTQLPRCSHLFHIHCIETWLLHGRLTCPLCRSSVFSFDGLGYSNSKSPSTFVSSSLCALTLPVSFLTLVFFSYFSLL